MKNATSLAQEAAHQVKGAGGTLYGLTVYNNNAGSQWIQIFDSAVAAAEGAVPVIVFEIATQTARTMDFGTHGRPFKNGIYVCNSSTDVTKTIGAADCLFDAQYE